MRPQLRPPDILEIIHTPNRTDGAGWSNWYGAVICCASGALQEAQAYEY